MLLGILALVSSLASTGGGAWWVSRALRRSRLEAMSLHTQMQLQERALQAARARLATLRAMDAMLPSHGHGGAHGCHGNASLQGAGGPW